MDDWTALGTGGLLEAAPDAIVGVDDTGRIVLVNAQAVLLFGYERGELIGEPVEILVPERGREVHPRHRRGYLDDPHPRPMGAGMELAGRRKDGSEFPAEISLSVIETGSGTLVAAAIRDVRDRKRAEARFRGLLEAAPDAIVGVDRGGRIALVNAQAERLFGYRRDELVGQAVEVLVPAAVRAVHPGRRLGYVSDPHPRPMAAGMELAGRRRDGSEFPAEISLSAVEGDDDELMVLAAVRDVTERIEAQAERARLKAEAERERLERRLQQSQRLESLGQLAGGVAHDFNNLLAVIMNYASFISEGLATAAADTGDSRLDALRGDVAQIEEAARRATALIRQLLAFARREVVRPTVVDINAVVREMETLLRRTLGEHVELVTSLSAGLRPVRADLAQLEQVLMNLAVNARDAMPGGGTLSIHTGNVGQADGITPVGDGDPPGAVRLEVSDTGSGMSEAVIARAFEPFFTTKRPGEGSGLGLATVYGIVAQAGGTVELRSEDGLGTTVSVLLPASADEDMAAEPEPVAGAPTGRETVLVVEDEAALLEVARRVLSAGGYRVLTASRGSEAIDVVRRHRGVIDLLLTDVVMPQMLGRDVAREVVAISPSTRVMFMSGYARPVLASQGTLEPGVLLIEKPFTASALLEGVRAALDRAPTPDGAAGPAPS